MIHLASIFDKYFASFLIVLLDVGAAGGLKKNWHSIENQVFKIFVEPEENAYRTLVRHADKKTLTLNIPLYKDQRTLHFYTCKKRGVSSIYQPNRDFLNQFPDAERFNIVKVAKLKTEAFDNIFQTKIAESSIQTIDFMKLDTQGSELDILQGAEHVLEKNVLGIEIEVEFAELYSGQHLFEEVHAYLKAHNFEILALQNVLSWRKQKFFGEGQIISADAVYFKKIREFIDGLRNLSPDIQKIQVIKYMTLCDLYGHFDRAYTLLGTFAHLFTDQEKHFARLLYQKRYLLTLIKTPSRILKAPRKLFHKIFPKTK